MAKSNVGLTTKIASEATASYSGSKAATADGASGNDSPTIGKSIPIIVGGARPEGNVIWCQTRRAKDGSCRGDIAICFGRNAFNRPLSLVTVSVDGTDIYSRKNGAVINPSGDVRFYDGTQTTADPLIVSVEGADNTPAWKGYIYAVVEDVLLDKGSTYHAEFSDTTQLDSGAHSQTCDPDLDGVDLVYDPRTGRRYGIVDPMSGDSYIIVSDGCQILSKVKIVSPFTVGYGGEDTTPADQKFYCDKVYPLDCEDMVVITGFGNPGETDSIDAAWHGVSISPVFNPWNGRMVHATINDETTGGVPNVPKNGLGKKSLWDMGGLPSSTDIDWRVSYRIPGGMNRVAYLRMYDPSDNFATSAAFTAGFPLDDADPTFDGSNIACQIANVRDGMIDYWYQDVGRSRTNDSPWKPKLEEWNVRGFPLVDDFLLCETGEVTIKLAGVKYSTGSFTVYIVNHTAAGIDVAATATITLPATDWTANGFNYEPKTQQVVVSAEPPPSSLTAARLYTITLGGSTGYYETATFTRVVSRPGGVAADGKVPMVAGDYGYSGYIDLTDGTESTSYYAVDATGAPLVFDLSRDLITIPTTGGTVTYGTAQVVPLDIPLQDVITDICSLKGYASVDLVFENFDNFYIRGMTISSTTRVADLLNRLGQLYGFIFAETDAKLKFRNRRLDDGSVTPDWTLTADDLVEADENVTLQRQAATSVLGSLALTWLDPDRDYESNNLLARRMAGVLSHEAGTRDEEISLPVAIDQTSARKLLYAAFYAMAEGETRLGFSVGPEHLRIEPGDLIELTADGSTRVVQVRSATHRADLNTLDIQADLFLAQAAPNIGSAGGNVTPPADDAISGAYIHLDIPLVVAPDYPGSSYVRQYHGITTFDAESWGGADFYRSADNVNFVKVLDYDVAPMAVAIAQNVLGDCPQNFALDTTEALIIKVAAGDPAAFATVDYYDMMGNVTLCAYGRAGAWELMAFQTVTDNGDGTITLSNLQRGLFGTNLVYYLIPREGTVYALDGEEHQVGDYICLLDAALIRSSVRPASEIGRTDRYAVVTGDVDIFAAMKPRHVMTGVSMRPPPAANVLAEHEAGSNDLVVTWNATSPIPHTWEDDGSEAVMPETYTYTVTIKTVDYGDFSFTTTAETYTWTAYGSTIGATVLAPDAITDVIVKVTSPVWGDSFRTSAFAIRET